MADITIRVAKHDVDIDFDLAVSMGHVPGFKSVHKFGLNETVGNAFETVWTESFIYVYLTFT